MSVIILLTLFGPYAQSASSQPLAPLKAAYIYNIAKFTRWPANTWANETASFGLCIYGNNDVANELGLVAGKMVGTHPVNVIYPDDKADFKQCQMLYVSPTEHKRFSYVLNLVDIETLLTISDSHRFIKSGGLINLRQVDKRLRFEINMYQLAHSEFTLSSKLLKISLQANVDKERK